MGKILVTGITGFAGSYLAEDLVAAGHDVHGTFLNDNTNKNLDIVKDKVQLHKLNILDAKHVEKLVAEIRPNVIYHLAAFTSPAESFKDPEKVINNNITGELYLLDAVSNTKTETRVLITSSAEVYGMVKQSDLPVNEKTELRPGSPYAVSKIAQDYLALQYHFSHGLDTIRVRPFNHIGPRQAPAFVVASFAKQIADIEKGKQEPILTVGNLDAKRDFTDVRDMVKAYQALIEKGENGEVYNIGSGVSHRIQEILDSLISLSEVKIEIKEDPAKLRPSDTPDIYSDNTKLEQTTGWKPTIPLAKTLQDTLNYWRETS